jgi:hypothetical protein
MILSDFEMSFTTVSSSFLATAIPSLTSLSTAQVGIYRCFRRCVGWIYRVELGIGSGAIVADDLGDVGDVEHSEKTRFPVNGLVAFQTILRIGKGTVSAYIPTKRLPPFDFRGSRQFSPFISSAPVNSEATVRSYWVCFFPAVIRAIGPTMGPS